MLPKDKVELDKKVGMGCIIRMNLPRSLCDRPAKPEGMDFNPKDKTLWTNDNQVDCMGDDIPPGEMNRIDKIGEDFGFPWHGGGHTRTNEHKTADAVFPRAGRARG